MYYVYMDNFRGFSNALLPISKNTFLVGENSTGKSSFLKLVQFMSDPTFWLSPAVYLEKDQDFGGFADIVSARAANKRLFRIGLVHTRKNDKLNTFKLSFNLLTFSNKEGMPHLVSYGELRNNKISEVVPEKNRVKYRFSEIENNFGEENEALDFVMGEIDKYTLKNGTYKSISSIKLPPVPLQMQVGYIRGLDSKDDNLSLKLPSGLPIGYQYSWIAPIRTKPKRFYDGLTKSFTPEGDHTPYLLKRSLKLKSKSDKFISKLKFFGNSSGLFETVTTHSYDAAPHSPFEVLIQFSGAKFNINNVGYGVSQVLPLIVEFLAWERKHGFIVQQPEVHLHPRAQAALGDLIYATTKEYGHSFLIETHSDYVIDRFRLQMSRDKSNNSTEAVDAQVIFFERKNNGNVAHILPLSKDGRYPKNQPAEFKSFFLNEEVALLDM